MPQAKIHIKIIEPYWQVHVNGSCCGNYIVDMDLFPDTEQSAVIQSSQQTEYVIRDLDRDVVYGVRMRSTSHSESSQRSDMKFGTPINNGKHSITLHI